MSMVGHHGRAMYPGTLLVFTKDVLKDKASRGRHKE
jgi:hypothetical protein